MLYVTPKIRAEAVMAKNEITKEDLMSMVELMYETIDRQKEYLSKLDTEIGDGDHGFSIANGFKSFCQKLEEYAELDMGQILKKGGFELIKNVGGAAGAVFGTFFTGQASYYEKSLKGKESLDLQDIANMFAEALAQIKKRGCAQPGDKTMVDALEPAVDSLLNSAAGGVSLADAFKLASEKASEGAERTKEMVATHGRAKNLGERSRGYMDPGSKTTSIIIQTIADYLAQ
jgi:dihydroxyacetone kinase-like protein